MHTTQSVIADATGRWGRKHEAAGPENPRGASFSRSPQEFALIMSDLLHEASGQDRRLLMISHCIPQRGPGPRGRAWQLLTSAAKTHDVYLVAIPDAPITLDQWRCTERKTARLALATSRSAQELRATADAWMGDEPFDTLVCTNVRLLRQTSLIPATQRICDAAGASAHGPSHWLSLQRDGWLTRRAVAEGNIVLNRDGIDSFLDALADHTRSQLLRQAA